MTNQERAIATLEEWAHFNGELSAINQDYDGDMSGAVEALLEAGLIAPDLPTPHITNLSSHISATLPGAGCMAPTDQYAPQFITIFGDEESSDATLEAGERLTAIKPEDLDKLIACLLAVRSAVRNQKGNETNG